MSARFASALVARSARMGLARTALRVAPRAISAAVAMPHRLHARTVSDDSHDDFKAQSKVPAGGTVLEKIDAAVKSSDVLLFMKGTPDFPQCGFSRQVVGILQQHGTKFDSVDVLADQEVREGIKKYSSWPTIPQLYVKGEFIGGCDIVTTMFQDGELEDLLKDFK